MLADLRHLLRSLRRSPTSAIAAVLTLSLALGVGTSIFAVVDSVLLTPPPFTNPQALAIVGETPIDEPVAAPRAVPYRTFEAWRERATALASLEAFDGANLTLTGLGAAERVSANDVTPRFLTLLGVTPALGRTFDLDDVGRPVAIISNAFWRGKLAGDPAVIGREIVLGGQRHTIVGVLPERFVFGLNRSDVWRPVPIAPAQAATSRYLVLVIARLAPNASPMYLAAALDDISRASTPPAHVVATSISTAIAGDATRTLGLLASAAAIAVLIAFTNLAGLLMVRLMDRRRELAVRSALGARHLEVAKQLLLEAIVLVATGTGLGVLLAFWTAPTVEQLALEQFGAAASRDIAVTWQVTGGISIMAFVAALICGSLPACVVARWRVVDVLRRGAMASPHEVSWRRVFVAGEVALAFVLLVSMALVGRALLTTLKVNPGFDPRGVMTLQVSLPSTRSDNPERVVSFQSTLQSALQERLGRHSVAIVDEIPLTSDRGRRLVSVGPTDARREAVVRTASPDYFEVMRIAVVAGRPFNVGDNAAVPTRVVVSHSLAQMLFASDRPIGQRIRLGMNAQVAEIIGVVGDVKHRALDETPLPTVYLSALQLPQTNGILVVRSGRPAAEVVGAVREEVARLDGNLPVYGVRPMQDVVAASPGVPARRLLTVAFTGFALLAMILSTIGLFGIAAHDVASRRTELALRIAVGASPKRILRATLVQSALTMGAGLAIGGLLSMWVSRGLSATGFLAEQFDALSVGIAAALLIATSAGAVVPVAFRAARTDPLTALHGE